MRLQHTAEDDQMIVLLVTLYSLALDLGQAIRQAGNPERAHSIF